MKQVRISNDGDEPITITLPNGQEIEIEPGQSYAGDKDVSIQLGTGNRPK